MKKRKMLERTVLMTFLFGLLVGGASAETGSVTLNLVNQDPDPAVAGRLVEIRLGLENRGSETLNDLKVKLAPEYPFELLPGSDGIVSVGSLRPFQSDEEISIVKARLNSFSGATSGSYDLDVFVYESGRENQTKVRRTVSLEIESREMVAVTDISRSALLPGEKGELSFTLKNVGSASLQDVTFSWTSEDDAILPVNSPNSRTLPEIGAGESVELKYDVMASTGVAAGLYKLSMEISYDDPITDENASEESVAGVYVGGGTDFEVAFSGSSDEDFTFSIANTGANPSYSVAVHVPEQDGWRAAGTDTSIIGNLEQGDYTVVTFQLEGTRNSGELALEIRYTDTAGERRVLSKKVSMPFSLASGTSSAIESVRTSNESGRPRGMNMVPQEGALSRLWEQVKLPLLAVAALAGLWLYRKKKG